MAKHKWATVNLPKRNLYKDLATLDLVMWYRSTYKAKLREEYFHNGNTPMCSMYLPPKLLTHHGPLASVSNFRLYHHNHVVVVTSILVP